MATCCISQGGDAHVFPYGGQLVPCMVKAAGHVNMPEFWSAPL
ncbi:hypothetical protein [Hoeflea sp.]|nr:hypothetical protein [Hoeflea sp.]